MSADGALQARVVSAIDFVLLLTFAEEQESRLAGQGTVGQSGENLFWDQIFDGGEELHAAVILIELHEKVSVVLFYGITSAAPSQVSINAYMKSELTN